MVLLADRLLKFLSGLGIGDIVILLVLERRVPFVPIVFLFFITEARKTTVLRSLSIGCLVIEELPACIGQELLFSEPINNSNTVDLWIDLLIVNGSLLK